MGASELNERQRMVLAAIIEDYIASAEPVGSRTITKRTGVKVSAATVRNVMSDLEEMGLLSQPHTSAGRIPTGKAFRFYVDTLVRLRKPSFREQDMLHREVRLAGNPNQVVEAATRHLSALSHHTGLFLAPRPSDVRLHHIEFVRLPDMRVLVIVVDAGGGVHNRMLEGESTGALEQSVLNRLTEHLSEKLRGLTLTEARTRLMDEMQQARAEMDALMMQALTLTDRVLSESDRGPKDVVLSGESRALENPEFAPLDKMKALLKTFEERHSFVYLLDRIEGAEEVQVFIGQETRFRDMADCSVVAAPYGTGDKTLGCIGVIGPVRMDYARVVPLVDLTAQMVTDALTLAGQGKGEPQS